jgi:hypothetical protein
MCQGASGIMTTCGLSVEKEDMQRVVLWVWESSFSVACMDHAGSLKDRLIPDFGSSPETLQFGSKTS